MSAVTQTAVVRTRYGFGGPGAIALFVLGVAGIVIGALVLADGILDYTGNTTVFLGSAGWWVNVVVGAVVIAASALAVGLSRRIRG